MKKLILALFALSFFVLSSDALALQCKSGQSLNSDECWTTVYIESGYPILVSRGHVLVASVRGDAVGDADGWSARHPQASEDIALGVAQRTIASGNSDIILARGRGVVNTGVSAGTVTSGDVLALTSANSGTGGRLLASGDVINANTAHLGKTRVATSLETQSTNDTENIAYIQIV